AASRFARYWFLARINPYKLRQTSFLAVAVRAVVCAELSKKRPSHAEEIIFALHRRGGAPDAAPSHSAGSRGARLDDDGDCGHDDGRTAGSQRRGHRSGEPWQHSFQFRGDFRHGVNARARHAGLAFLRSWKRRRLSSFACERRVPELRNHAFSDGDRAAVRARAPLTRYSSFGTESSYSVPARLELGHTAAVALFCFSPLSPRHEPGKAGDVRADFCKFRESRGELGACVRSSGISSAGNCGF